MFSQEFVIGLGIGQHDFEDKIIVSHDVVGMQDLKNLAQVIRAEVTEKKNAK